MVGRTRSWLTRAILGLSLGLGLASAPVSAGAAEPQSCKLVRLSDIGWTDVTATTALASVMLERLGYQTKTTVLSVPVTYAAMKNKDVDVFLGNWMPSMAQDRAPFEKDGSIEVIRANLTGAKYTLAVPEYTWAAGLKDFSDIPRFAAQLNHSIYGIEPGNDGNRQVLSIIKSNMDGLGDFKLIESSEQGMLAEVERAIRDHRPVVFGDESGDRGHDARSVGARHGEDEAAGVALACGHAHGDSLARILLRPGS